VRSDDEMSLCSSSSAVVSALGKRSYGWITGSVEGVAFAAGGRGGAAGRRAQWENATAGNSDSALLPGPDKRKKRGVRRGGTPTPAQAPTPWLLPPPSPPPAICRWSRWRSLRA
jgi:hypothetical protein